MTPFQARTERMPHEREFSFCRTKNELVMETKVNIVAQPLFQPVRPVIELVSEIAERYRLVSIEPLLATCRAVAEQDELSVAVVGRFKAGKSSFLNHFLGRDLLPVGVVPVTTVVTEIGYGAHEKAMVHFFDGQVQEITIENLRSFVAESENPENKKQVSTLKIELPQLARMRSLRFVDMPGLESALAHNTEAALHWLPNVGLALVAVSVDPALSQHDLSLLKRLYEYTPKVAILLTKVDLLNDAERAEVAAFVSDRLAQAFGSAPPIFPYSVRPGYEHLKTQIEDRLIRGTLAQFEKNRSAVLGRKLETLLRECHGYLTLALKSAETAGSEREAIKRLVIGEKKALDEVKSELRLVIEAAAAGARAAVAQRLQGHQSELEKDLLTKLRSEFPRWTNSLSFALESFQQWLGETLTEALLAISGQERTQLVTPLEKLKQQVFRTLERFRDRLSDKTLRAFGVALRTTEPEIQIAEPHTPDIRIGRVFDHNWELLSPVVPMWLAGPLVHRHFAGQLSYVIEKNLSRLASQWDESLRTAMTEILREAQQRLDDLVATVERLTSTSGNEATGIRADLERIGLLLEEARNDTSRESG
jgi:GTP-binding protein EngB required for normal cell division